MIPLSELDDAPYGTRDIGMVLGATPQLRRDGQRIERTTAGEGYPRQLAAHEFALSIGIPDSILQAEDAQATLVAQKQAFATQLAQARRSYEVGLSPITDVSESQARYDLTLAQEIAARLYDIPHSTRRQVSVDTLLD